LKKGDEGILSEEVTLRWLSEWWEGSGHAKQILERSISKCKELEMERREYILFQEEKDQFTWSIGVWRRDWESHIL
jgi:hypothetical protein